MKDRFKKWYNKEEDYTIPVWFADNKVYVIGLQTNRGTRVGSLIIIAEIIAICFFI
jgi:hypothetical protein